MQRISSRDREVIECLFRGMNNREMCQELGIEKRTAVDHISKLCRIMGIDTRKYIARVRIVYLISIQRGLINPPHSMRIQ